MPVHLITATGPRDVVTRLADALMEEAHPLDIHGTGAFEQAPPDWRFEAFLPEAPDGGEWAVVVESLIGTEAARGLAFEHRTVADTDWVAMSLEELPPVRVGRLVVHGEHDRHKVRVNEIALGIEASVAFGTGHHGTTVGCLEAMDRIARVGRTRPGMRAPRVLDVGTGTGVLALALVKALRARAVATDNDADAVRIARVNARANGLDLKVVRADGTGHPAVRALAPYDVVVANILAGPLVRLAPGLARVTRRGGRLVLSGLLAWQARLITGLYRAQGFRLDRRRIIGDWATLEFIRR